LASRWPFLKSFRLIDFGFLPFSCDFAGETWACFDLLWVEVVICDEFMYREVGGIRYPFFWSLWIEVVALSPSFVDFAYAFGPRCCLKWERRCGRNGPGCIL